MLDFDENIILLTDSYKQTHYRMLPYSVGYLGSYFEARAGGEYDETVFFGLQYIMRRYLEGVRVTQRMIDEAKALCTDHFAQDLLNISGWQRIVDVHGGKLPVSIKAAPEGTVIGESNVLLTIENTDPNLPWLTNHLETLLVQLWYMCTVATISRQNKKVLLEALKKTGTPEKLPVMLHDFGCRGSSSMESAATGGAAHLVNFIGTDTMPAMVMLMKYYNTDVVPGISVPAAEHSTITSWGKHSEVDAYRNILERYPSGFVSVVSDSWDIYNACENIWGGVLKDEVLNNKDRTLVIRPDSGEPTVIVPTCLEILGEKMGYSVNDKGYKVLPDNVRMIQGDGITRHSLPSIVQSIIDAGWSLDNIVFGSGGGLLQDCNRDTLRFAMKCSWTKDKDGKKVWRVSKAPASDPTKNSKSGKLKLVKSYTGEYETVGLWDARRDNLVEVFRNGTILNETTLEAVRERAAI